MIGFEGAELEKGFANLVLAAPGTGELQWITSHCDSHTLRMIDCRTLQQFEYPAIADTIRSSVSKCDSLVVILYCIHLILPRVSTSVAMHRIRSTVRHLLSSTSDVTLVGVSPECSLVDPEFVSRCGDNVFTVGNLTGAQRYELVEQMIPGTGRDSLTLHGFTRADLIRLVRMSLLYPGGVHEAIQHVTPAALLQEQRDVLKSGCGFSDLVGLSDAKQTLRFGVVMPLLEPNKCSRFGAKLPSGVLITGPHGCGKTMIARALTVETGLNVISIGAPDLVHKTVGDSERAVSSVFTRARAVSPSILLLDQIDAFASPKQHEGTHTRDRLIAAIISEMDTPHDESVVLVVATAHDASLITPSLLAPGRLELQVVLSLPTAQDRLQMFQSRLGQMRVDPDVSEEFIRDELVVRTAGLSASDVFAQCQAAALAALREDLSDKCRVHRRHFMVH